MHTPLGTDSRSDLVTEPARPPHTRRHFRTVFLSDLHLGSTGSQARDLARLLKRIECDKLYLVGDVIDMWRLKKKWYWPREHNEVVRRVLKLVKNGTEVVYIPGNHDEAMRQYAGIEFGGVQVRLMDRHETADGRQLLITHGDQFDLVVKHSPTLSMLGGLAYEWLIRLNHLYNKGRQLLGLRYWSLSNFVKLKVKQACKVISRFEHAVIQEARRYGLDGVVCGHIHKAEATTESGLEYFNCGDWVESMTVLVEHESGKMEVLQGASMLAEMKQRETAEEARRHDEPEPISPIEVELDGSWSPQALSEGRINLTRKLS